LRADIQLIGYCENATSSDIHHHTYHSDGASTLYVNDVEIQYSFAGESYAECAKQATRVGWKLSRDRTQAYCPICVKIENDPMKYPKRHRRYKRKTNWIAVIWQLMFLAIVIVVALFVLGWIS